MDGLLARTTVVTPNLSEAELLAGEAAPGDPETLARAIHALSPAAVVVTGGHRDEATDLFHDGDRTVSIAGERHPDGAAHGSGCTHSSALAAGLALGLDPLQAARMARDVAGEAVRNGLRDVGAGAGPVDVFALAAGDRAEPPAWQSLPPGGGALS